jgi:hypothetical protein
MITVDRHGRRPARTHAVTLDGEPIAVPPVDEVALSARYLLG